MKIMPRRRVEIPLKDIFKIIPNILFPEKNAHNGIENFQKTFARFIGVKYAIVVPSARLGLSVFLDTVPYENNDEVILSSFNYHVIAALFKNKGLKPIFVDIDPHTLNMNPELIEEKITSKTKFLIATHLFGKTSCLDPLVAICKKHNILLIEDAAHACGGEYHQKKLGNFGDLSFFSFGTGKALVALKGGMLTTNDDRIYQNLKNQFAKSDILIDGMSYKKLIKPILETILTNRIIFSFFVYPGLLLLNLITPQIADKLTEDKYTLEDGTFPEKNSSFQPFQASLGLNQLQKLESSNARRIYLATQLNSLLKDIDQIKIPIIEQNKEHVALYYTIIAEKAAELRKFLFLRGVDSKKGTMRACSALSFLENSHSCPVAENIAPKAIELPCYPSLRLEEIYYQANLIRKFYGKNPLNFNERKNSCCRR